MTLLDDLTAEYHRQFPDREGRPIFYPDWLPALLIVLDRRLARKLDRLLPVENKASPDE